MTKHKNLLEALNLIQLLKSKKFKPKPVVPFNKVEAKYKPKTFQKARKIMRIIILERQT